MTACTFVVLLASLLISNGLVAFGEVLEGDERESENVLLVYAA